jgi:hypothetical protein
MPKLLFFSKNISIFSYHGQKTTICLKVSCQASTHFIIIQSATKKSATKQSAKKASTPVKSASKPVAPVVAA